MAESTCCFPYVGGKSQHARMIASVLDTIPHECYIEPFCGAASVYFAKKPARVNCLNDMNHNITAIFTALREHPVELMKLLYRCEYSEDLYNEAHRELFRKDLDVVSRAAYHLVLLHMMGGRPHSRQHPKAKKYGCHNPAFIHGTTKRFLHVSTVLGVDEEEKIRGGGSGITHGTSKTCGAAPKRIVGSDTDETKENPSVATLLGVPEWFFGRYWPFINKLRRKVQIMNRDGFDILERLDKPGVLFYIDPPYEETRGKEFYSVIDHDRLEEVLKGMQHAKWAISQYDTEKYNSRYADYEKITKETRMRCVGGTKNSPPQHKVTEVVWVHR